MELLGTMWASIRWQDAVDITIASYILFRFYVLFRGTYVFRVITGLLLLWVFQRITVYTGLIVTSWAIKGVTAVAAFIIIVVFRNELRSVLQAKNIKTILWGFADKSPLTPIETIIKGIFGLRKKRIGALIVFPGKKDLEDFVHSGIPWGGQVSEEMLLSIFWPDNPVHDGAAIISGMKVEQVGAILPLSDRQDLPSYYGTRHRAAAGLAEATDALVVVVSEERERISIAQGSILREVENDSDLVQSLQNHFGEVVGEKNGKTRGQLRLGAAAILSLFFITGIWLSFTQGRDTLITLEVPIEYMNRDPAMEIVTTSTNSAKLQLSGSGTLIKSIRPEQVQVRLDLGKAVVGNNNYTIIHDDITLPPGVALKSIDPRSVEVFLDVPIEKSLPVQVDWVDNLPEKLVMESVRVYPETVRVVGSSLILNDIETVYTQKASLRNLTQPGTLKLGLVLDNAALQISSGSAEMITVEYIIKKRS